jgi:hypothetical protein
MIRRQNKGREMAYRHEWDNESQSIYRVEFFDNWTWEEFSLANSEVYKLLARSEKRVDFIVWFKGVIPKGNAFPHLRRAGGSQPPTIYRTVMIIETGGLIEQLTSIVDKTQKWEGPAFAKTLEEARALLAGTEEEA